ncbi:hypothetical protein DY000_02014874 [Brassica cretica]|uniref:Uncharacterized protein n=1 Tax=Brassica cretica TaxID=69181 RepID=A0ABQ7D8E0_BRACR|nr:hypothetical protein DY000_02014874 [Brassica cretica]
MPCGRRMIRYRLQWSQNLSIGVNLFSTATSFRSSEISVFLADLSGDESLPDEVWVKFVRLVAEGSNPHGTERLKHVGVKPKSSEGLCVTKSSRQDLSVEECVISLCGLFVPPFAVDGEEHWVVEIDRLTLLSHTRPWVRGRGIVAWRRHVVLAG